MVELTLTDGTRVPVHTIFAVARNYAGHARELDNPVPESPVVFIKPDTALLADGGTIPLPAVSRDVHHEVELVALLGRGGRNIPEAQALDCVLAYGVGIDVTARDLQNRAKAQGLPWTLGKGLDGFAPLSVLVPASELPDPQDVELRLTVNGRERQHGHTGEMLFPVARLIHYLSTLFTLQRGDLVFTGTPAGVARFDDGDVLEAAMGRPGAEPLARLKVSARRRPD